MLDVAAALQQVASLGSLVADDATERLTRTAIDFEAPHELAIEGGTRVVRGFVARGARARFGSDLIRTHDAPFIGRKVDLAILAGVFDKTLESNAAQLVMVVGEPGIGKSRIVAELFSLVDDRPELVIWRQGRCLPYGEGVAFWALGEVLKAHAGIYESDDPAAVHAKLEMVLPDGAEREWLRQRLLPLLGLEASSLAEREELFAAWRTFWEQVAERSPTVLVFEDLHWADPAMVAFVEHLAGYAEGVPLLVVGTTRPELYDNYPGFGQTLRNAHAVRLQPLSQQDTARLVSALLETALIPAELQGPILERSEGNPLYVQEFIRLLKDRGLLVRKGSSWELASDAEIPFPDSLQALITARLDTLSPEHRGMLSDAAVIGKTFWAGAVAAIGNLPEADVRVGLRELSHRGLVRPVRRASMEGESEYVFGHVLVRDVAYAQLARRSRAARHSAAASWIESKASERLEDVADVLAHHYVTALELAQATAQPELAEELEAPALRYLTLAGETALGLDTAAALTAFERALRFTPAGHPARPRALARFGEAAREAGHPSQAATALEEAVTAFRSEGNVASAAQVIATLSSVYECLNDPRAYAMGGEALAMLEALPPGPQLVEALCLAAGDEVNADDLEAAHALTERALDITTDLGLPRPSLALSLRGFCRCLRGDARGVADLRLAVRVAIEAGEARRAALAYNNLGVIVSAYEGPTAALEVLGEGLQFAESRGLTEMALAIRTSSLSALMEAGELDQVLALAAGLAEEAALAGDEFDLMEIRALEVSALAQQGRPAQAADYLDSLVPNVRRLGRRDRVITALGPAALVLAALEETDAATVMLAEVEAAFAAGGYSDSIPSGLPMIVRTAVAIGQVELAERLARRSSLGIPYAEHALVAARAALAEAHGQVEAAATGYAEAAARWEGFGGRSEQAMALLGWGRCLLRLAEPARAAAVLQDAREILASCGMRPALDEADSLLAEASALSSWCPDHHKTSPEWLGRLGGAASTAQGGDYRADTSSTPSGSGSGSPGIGPGSASSSSTARTSAGKAVGWVSR